MNIEVGSDTEESVEYDDANDDRDDILLPDWEVSDEEPAESGANNMLYNSYLPTLHSYLGRNFIKLNSPTGFIENAVYLNLPLLPRGGFILFPGQTLPMKVFRTDIVHMLERVIQTDHLVGVVYENKQKNANTGIIAEIFEFDNRSFKARGTKRFKILRLIVEDGYTSADVKILPEVNLGPALFAQRLTSLDRVRVATNTKDDLDKREKLDRLDTVMSLWPHWVYKQYDALRLSLQLRELVTFFYLKGCPPVTPDPVVPTDPVELSFWFAQNFLVNDEDKLAIFNSDCVVDRLRKEIDFLTLDHNFVCCSCGIFISQLSGLFPISKEGPQGTYVNGNGDIFEVLTFLNVRGLTLYTMPLSINCTWFPGYGWIIAKCEVCRTQIGWKFVAVNKALALNTFWGLARNSLRVTKIRKNNELTTNMA